MLARNPYNAYKKQSIETVSQQQLVVLLYEGMIKFIKRAIIAVDKKDFEGVHVNLSKTNNILLELISGLNMEQGGEIAYNLKRLYVYSYERLTHANLKKDKAIMEEILNVISPLTEAWRDVRDSRQIVGEGRSSPNNFIKSA